MSPIPWFKVDDSLAFHAKVVAAGNAALGLWVRAGAWSSQQLTDGHIPSHMVTALGNAVQAKRLVEVGLWEKEPGGYRFWQWDERNPRREQVEEDRAAARERMRKARESKRSAPDVRANAQRSSAPVAVTPTRPDPTRPEVPVVQEVGETGGRRGQQREQHDDDALHGLLEEHTDAVGPLSPASQRALTQHLTDSLQRAEPDQVREALRRYRARAASGQRTLPGLLPRLVDDVLQAQAAGAHSDDPLAHPDAVAFLAAQNGAHP